ncbi:Alkaline phosphatase D [Sphingomonas antarctica]|uniref:alkaline phosphatase D family protein n=1 Tax=Sphingomonas antarctica TaxID=2040274 RepID=UPI0039E9F84D
MIQIDRRAMIQTGMFGLGSLMLPGGRLAAQALLGLTGFTHDVASGEPAQDSVLLWTRFKPQTGGPARVAAEISLTTDFARPVGGAAMTTGPWRDHTVKLTIDGLQPGTRYFYRFIAPDGAISPIGRTKTLPAGKVGAFRLATFSCSNIGYGELNAYGHAAARDDVDAVLHLGDYFYEYGRGGYDLGPEFSARIFPAGELLNLVDYRLRYAAYRTDPQLLALHRAHPWLASTDDHEVSNDSWEGGAQNHQPDEGDFTMRKLAAIQAWHEWLPVGEAPWKTYQIGDLATYYRTNTREIARSRQDDYKDIERGNDIPKALAEFRDGPWRDAARTMFGTEQESWLSHAFKRDTATWQLLGVGTNVGYNAPTDALMALMPVDASERGRSYIREGIAAGKAGLPYNLDNWGGYPAAKARLLGAAQAADSNLCVLTGDSHNAWAFDLKNDGRAAGVEFGGTSVTSSGMEQSFKGVDPATVQRTILAGSTAELRWCDTSNRGYMHTTVTAEAVTNEYVFMDTVKRVSLDTKPSHRVGVRRGRNVLDTV